MKEKLANIGEVTAKLYRIRKLREIDGDYYEFKDAVGSEGVPEKALKGRAISSRATYVLAPAPNLFNISNRITVSKRHKQVLQERPSASSIHGDASHSLPSSSNTALTKIFRSKASSQEARHRCPSRTATQTRSPMTKRESS